MRNAKWNLELPLHEARRNGEVVALSDSQVLRWIDELNGVNDTETRAASLWKQIRTLRKENNSSQNRRLIRKLYAELDEVQCRRDYLLLIIDRERDYKIACGGFSINGIKYVRLLGTNGGIKNSTIVFVSERLSGELLRRIDNGRDRTKELVPAKFEAYRALTCSASTPVSDPKGLLVVNDCETKFVSPTLYLNDEGEGEPVLEYQQATDVTLNATDGCGMILPSLAERWSEELGLDYILSGLNSRYSWEKGMLFTFDFVDFAEKVAHTYFVKDAWGDMVDIRNVEVVMTTSMVKLWDSYKSCEDYLRCSHENHYSFCVTKVCPEILENERYLNYQFIQSFQMSKDDVEELIAPTIQLFKDVLGGDWRKTVLFLQGTNMAVERADRLEDSVGKALMIDQRVVNDPYVQGVIYSAIKNKINEAKTGVLKIHGNYSIISGDLYALCQSMFCLPVTGILRAGEIYNEYWTRLGSTELLCFRAPMSVHNNIRKVRPNHSEEAAYWYRYIHTGTIFNAWDTASAALNGADFDGDLVMLTDNAVLLRNHVDMPALMCVQRKADKRVPDDSDLIKSNIESFGNEIGKVTNRITAMYEVMSHFPVDSPEYNELQYRIKCGQLYQQNVIDKAKGIVAKPMPKEWYDRHSIYDISDEAKRRLYFAIAADKKPYFMRYIYRPLMREYNEYRKKTDRNALREFGMTVDELSEIPYCRLTERQTEFLRYYNLKMPVGVGDCVMNQICLRFEQEFDSVTARFPSNESFDYSIYKFGRQYPKAMGNRIRQLYFDYNQRIQSYRIYASYDHPEDGEAAMFYANIARYFLEESIGICQNAETLCDVMLDVCYGSRFSKHFVWELCGSEIVRSLLQKHEGVLAVPVKHEAGDVEFGGERFVVMQATIGGYTELDCFE